MGIGCPTFVGHGKHIMLSTSDLGVMAKSDLQNPVFMNTLLNTGSIYLLNDAFTYVAGEDTPIIASGDTEEVQIGSKEGTGVYEFHYSKCLEALRVQIANGTKLYAILVTNKGNYSMEQVRTADGDVSNVRMYDTTISINKKGAVAGTSEEMISISLKNSSDGVERVFFEGTKLSDLVVNESINLKLDGMVAGTEAVVTATDCNGGEVSDLNVLMFEFKVNGVIVPATVVAVGNIYTVTFGSAVSSADIVTATYKLPPTTSQVYVSNTPTVTVA